MGIQRSCGTIILRFECYISLERVRQEWLRLMVRLRKTDLFFSEFSDRMVFHRVALGPEGYGRVNVELTSLVPRTRVYLWWPPRGQGVL